MIKIAYFWTWEFSKNILNDIIKSWKFDLSLIVSQVDKKVWRKQILEETPVKVLWKQHNIEVIQPLRLKENVELFEKLKSLDLDFIIVVAYWKIIPKEILDIAKYYPINIHGSILPQYRWASPIQESLKNWDTETWLTIMQMSEGMDEWDIFSIKKIKIDILDKTPDIFKKFESFAVDLLVESLEWIINWKLKWQAQDSSRASYCSKIEKNDWKISFKNESSNNIYNKFRAYYPWPWIFTYYKDKKLSIEDCFFDEKTDYTWKKGSIIKLDKSNFWIICNSWILIIKKVKLEWKKEMNINDFINWNKDILNYTFE